ncbi:40S ribosomal protein S29 [Cryptococcus gattii]
MINPAFLGISSSCLCEPPSRSAAGFKVFRQNRLQPLLLLALQVIKPVEPTPTTNPNPTKTSNHPIWLTPTFGSPAPGTMARALVSADSVPTRPVLSASGVLTSADSASVRSPRSSVSTSTTKAFHYAGRFGLEEGMEPLYHCTITSAVLLLLGYSAVSSPSILLSVQQNPTRVVGLTSSQSLSDR